MIGGPLVGQIKRLVGLLAYERLAGSCCVCGRETIFLVRHSNYRETLDCLYCGSIARNRHLAIAVLQSYGVNEETPFCLWARSTTLKIYEAASYGPIHEALVRAKGYVCSEFFPGIPPGKCRRGIRCEDLQSLSFGDQSFDLVITQDVFEHVECPERAFREVWRVLKPGGLHIFTVPLNERVTRRRIDPATGAPLLPQVYHGDRFRRGGILVYTDFGTDITDILHNYGFEAFIHHYHDPSKGIYDSKVVISQKLLC